MFFVVACVAEAILRKSALKFSLCIEEFFLQSLATGGLNVPIFTNFGTGTYETLGHLKRLEISTLVNFYYILFMFLIPCSRFKMSKIDAG